MSAPTAAAAAASSTSPPAAKPMLLPQKGTARVKNVMSGDTVVLWGKAAAPHLPPPQVQFTLEGLMAPRLSSRNYPTDDPGAFPARETLRQMLVGKMVSFETTRRKPQGGGGVVAGAAGEAVTQNYYHYGHLFFNNENVALSILKNGNAKVRDDFSPPSADADASGDAAPKAESAESEAEQSWKKQFAQAYQEGLSAKVGIHAAVPPLVRSPKNVEDALAFVQKTGQVTAVIEYIFDGSRYRCQVTKASDPEYVHSSFTVILAGVICPRANKPTQPMATPLPSMAPNQTPEEELRLGQKARLFVEERMLQRELTIVFHGTDKSGVAAVATLAHPKGNIAVELLKNGLARMADWTVRLMDAAQVPPFRIAENNAKRAHSGIWAKWEVPQLSGASEITGTCIEVHSGDTLLILPAGNVYDKEDVLQKISLASIRAPRMGSERLGRQDEPYAWECKERLRVLCAGKQVKIQIHYERDIALTPELTERRRFGTFAVGKRPDVGELLLTEGLANTQRHRDDDEKSPRYDDLRTAEAVAKAAKKGMHSEGEYRKGAINDLTEPRKAKAYSGSLMRAGTMKAIVEYVFNGSRFKIHIPSENCHVIFAPNVLRCPQPSPSPGAARQGKVAEPFGDESKRHARMTLLQRPVEIVCSGVTMGGVITGSIWVGQAGQRRDFSLELVNAGLATVDQRKIDYGEAPKHLVEAQLKAQAGKVGLWALERATPDAKGSKPVEKTQVKTAKIRLSEIRNGHHFYFHVVDDDAAKVTEDSMKVFTQTHGTTGGPCDTKVGKVVAALFDDGSGKSWYRAKIVEKSSGGKVAVLFVDHGNISTVPVASHLRPLDMSLGTDRIPAVAKEAVLAMTVTRSLDHDEGVDAARTLQQMGWGKDLTCQMFGPDENGRLAVALVDPSSTDASTINEELVSSGLARVAKQDSVKTLVGRMVDGNPVVEFAATLNVAQERARKTRSGMWRYGDIGDDDDEGA